MVSIFEDAAACAVHCKRITIFRKDLDLVFRLRGMKMVPRQGGKASTSAGTELGESTHPAADFSVPSIPAAGSDEDKNVVPITGGRDVVSCRAPVDARGRNGR